MQGLNPRFLGYYYKCSISRDQTAIQPLCQQQNADVGIGDLGVLERQLLEKPHFFSLQLQKLDAAPFERSRFYRPQFSTDEVGRIKSVNII
jgi:hypothetical protein